MNKVVNWVCTKCGCSTCNSGTKPPAKWTNPCRGNKKTGLHVWVKG